MGITSVHAKQQGFLFDDARGLERAVALAGAARGDATLANEGGDGGAVRGDVTATPSARGAALALPAPGAGDDLMAELEGGALAGFGGARGFAPVDDELFIVPEGDVSTLAGSLATTPRAGWGGGLAGDDLAAAVRGAGDFDPLGAAGGGDGGLLPPGGLVLDAGPGDVMFLMQGGDMGGYFGDDGGGGGLELVAAGRSAALAPARRVRIKPDAATTITNALFRQWVEDASPLVLAPGAVRGRGAAAAAPRSCGGLRARLAPADPAAGPYPPAMRNMLLARMKAIDGEEEEASKRKRAPRARAGSHPPLLADAGAGVHDFGFGVYGEDAYGVAAEPPRSPWADGATPPRAAFDAAADGDDGVDRLRRAFLGSQPHLRTSPGSYGIGGGRAVQAASSDATRPSSDDASPRGATPAAKRARGPDGRPPLTPLHEHDGTQFPEGGDGSLLEETQRAPRTRLPRGTAAATRATVAALEARFRAAAAAGRPPAVSVLAAADAAGGRLGAARVFAAALAAVTGGYARAAQAAPMADIVLTPGARMAALTAA